MPYSSWKNRKGYISFIALHPVLMSSTLWHEFGICCRYQILAGVIEQRILEPMLHNQKLLLSVMSFGVRTGNTFLGSLMYVSNDPSHFVSVSFIPCNNANDPTSCSIDGKNPRSPVFPTVIWGRLITLSMHLQVLCKARKHNATGFVHHVWMANWIQTIIIMSLTNLSKCFNLLVLMLSGLQVP